MFVRPFKGVGMPDPVSHFVVPIEKLCWTCDPDQFPFVTTDELTPLEGIVGQERAQKALALGVEMMAPGYNIYVCGFEGTGRLTAVQQLLAKHQGEGSPSPDLCYVLRFQQLERPRLLSLAAGQGRAFKEEMERLMADLKREIPLALASEDVKQRIKGRYREAQQREERLIQELEKLVAPDFGLHWHASDGELEPELAPYIAGHLVPLADLASQLASGELSSDRYRSLHAEHRAFGVECDAVFTDIRRLRQAAEEDVRTIERAHVRPLIHKRVAVAAAKFVEDEVQVHFREVTEALVEDSNRFSLAFAPSDKEGSGSSQSLPAVGHSGPGYDEELFHDYQVNLLIDNAEATGPPVILEMAPTYKNLFGSIDPVPEHGGVSRSNFTSIRAGSVHRANGGYLIFHAIDALVDPMVWSSLKRLLRYGQVDIQSQDHSGFGPGTVLKPDLVPCDVKVILIGDDELYDTMAREDEYFTRLFKVKADFAMTLPRNRVSIARYADFLRRIENDENLRPCDREAVAAIVEFGVRLAGRQNKLSARLEVIADVLREADYWSRKGDETPVITRAAVNLALWERSGRINLLETQLHELIATGILLMATQGSVVGQVNGLVVYEVDDDYCFGCPVRITATTTMGDTGVVNIEREVELSDPTHNKGVLILSGYLRYAFAYDKPLTLSASLCVEQSYEGIAGDSASAAEIVAVLSSLAGVAVDQGIAMTGSVNQKGELQPVSGVNEKIEGFFDTCRQQGITGTQGVILPLQNVDDLMLRRDVIEAVVAGEFYLYAVRHIDDALPLLMGLPAGGWEPERGYPSKSVNGRVDAQLQRFVDQWSQLRSSIV